MKVTATHNITTQMWQNERYSNTT